MVLPPKFQYVRLPYGQLPSQWIDSLSVRRVDETLWFQDRGPAVSLRIWLDELHEANPGDLLPLQWAPAYIGVSRTAIRKRALAGQLVVFSFELIEPKRGFLGKSIREEVRGSFDYVLKSECAAWHESRFRLPEDNE